MSMLDSFFNKGFKAAKCKTLLKLTIPRIKLLRNRREIQIRQMRRDIAKLLETGQEATARIRVEHIIREENMMAAQEIIELYAELISVRLPIVESQRECPLDLKEAISSLCFAAPRCADLPELLQVQMLFVSKYGKEFVSAATELMPDCGVSRQLIELLSVRAPSAEKKLKLLKEIAEEHELDWDPAASEAEIFKPHEDLLNGPTQFVSGSKLPLPEEKHDETLYCAPDQAQKEQSDSDDGLDVLDFPEVPKVSSRPTESILSAPAMAPPFPPPPHPDFDHELSKNSEAIGHPSKEPSFESGEERAMADKHESHASVGHGDDVQFLPFISPPSLSSASFPVRQTNPPPPSLSRRKSEVNVDMQDVSAAAQAAADSAAFPVRQTNPPPPSLSRRKSEVNVDMQDVLAAAQAAADSAERAAAAARSAASLAQVRINELTKKNNEEVSESSCENPFHEDVPNQSATGEKSDFDHHIPDGDSSGVINSPEPHQGHGYGRGSETSNLSFKDSAKVDFDSPLPSDNVFEHEPAHHQPQRLTSMDDDPYFSYPNLFTSENNVGSGAQSSTDNSRFSHEH
ncbi:putative vacuolar protein sorting-associated protein Ist1 [Rosa chinensis]|uniref:Putative vacuolar protein sorting-associated protein Ist1 n=1 Tax=Rosa chinensis TaxID=74649 RepID=A0A2P6PRE2_ROSCH|nr:putative vacuolar protein sorting-associated protein Ist1 [Rosa chinensis]